MEKSKISIIIPVYNVEKYLDKCLESVVNQTYENIEIILIDDGSTDNSGKICDKYAEKDNRIKVIHQKNSGVSVARNKGLDIFTGDYIMFVDPDDWIELNTCEVLIKEIMKENKDVIVFNITREYGTCSKENKDFILDTNDIDLKNKTQAKILSSHIKIRNFDVYGVAYTWNKFINSKIIDRNRFSFEGKKAMYEDVLFYYCLFEKINKIGYCNEHLYHYRISGKYSFNEDIIDIMDEFYNTVKKYELNHKTDVYYKQSIYNRMILILHKMLNVYIYHKDLNKGIIERQKILKIEISKPQYKEAIKNININNLNNYLKIYVILFRLKCYFLIYILNKLELFKRNKVTNREII